MIDSRRIAKNTVFLYTRLIFILLTTLYTSRIVIDKLGIDDYGLYNVIFSAIGLLSFLNATLSTGTSRFITFDLGLGDALKLRKTFSTALVTHLLLGAVVLLIGETVGLWYLHEVMVVPPERFAAAETVYQLSLFMAVISILQVPFTSAVMAHEKMEVYAYMGIYEAIAKLGIVFLLSRATVDKMVLYAALVALVSLSVTVFYVAYTKRVFNEVHFSLRFDKKTFDSILRFSGWNIVTNLSSTFVMEGVIMLFNLFFLPVVVASQAVASQISRALLQFVDSVRVAVNPQVIKLYADGNREESKRLTLRSAEYIFDLLLVLCLPCILVMPTLLDVWLVDVPEYAVIFAQIIVFQNIIENFNAAFYTPMLAANKIRKNSLAAIVLCIGQFILLYFLFKLGCDAIWARYTGLFVAFAFSFAVKPYILRHDIDYTYQEMYECIGHCMKVLLAAGAATIGLYLLIPQTNVLSSLLLAVLDVAVVAVVCYLFLDKKLRIMLMDTLRKKLKHTGIHGS